MTEADWLSSPDTSKLKRHLGHPLSRRKCLLAVCAYGLRVAQHVSIPGLVDHLREWEAKADIVPLSPFTMDEVERQSNAMAPRGPMNFLTRGICRALNYLIFFATDAGSTGSNTPVGLRREVVRVKCPAVRNIIERPEEFDPEARSIYTSETAAFNNILWDIFGNPFRPVTLSPEWRTDTVLSMVKEMYQSRDFFAMPVLADALQEAGCEDERVLEHCRGPGPHVRGCWVVDLLLGKE